MNNSLTSPTVTSSSSASTPTPGNRLTPTAKTPAAAAAADFQPPYFPPPYNPTTSALHHNHHQFDLHNPDAYSPYHQYANNSHHHNPYALSAAAAASASAVVGERLMRASATGDSLPFSHQYDAASRAYSEYASYYAASRHAAVLDSESLHLYRNGIFSASSENNPVFRVSPNRDQPHLGHN
jgi:hypothetical protein